MGQFFVKNYFLFDGAPCIVNTVSGEVSATYDDYNESFYSPTVDLSNSVILSWLFDEHATAYVACYKCKTGGIEYRRSSSMENLPKVLRDDWINITIGTRIFAGRLSLKKLNNKMRHDPDGNTKLIPVEFPSIDDEE